jgi:hypothetical protein
LWKITRIGQKIELFQKIWKIFCGTQKYFGGTQFEKHCFRNSEFVSSIWIESFETKDSWSWIEQLVMSDQCNLFKLRWIYMTTIYKKILAVTAFLRQPARWFSKQKLQALCTVELKKKRYLIEKWKHKINSNIFIFFQFF